MKEREPMNMFLKIAGIVYIIALIGWLVCIIVPALRTKNVYFIPAIVMLLCCLCAQVARMCGGRL